MKMLLRAVVTSALAVSAVAVPGTLVTPAPAAAQGCTVEKKPNWALPWAWEIDSGVGTVTSFGDLKVRFVKWNTTYDGNYAGAYLDLKAPGFAVNELYLATNTYIRYTICGQEVTVANENNTLRISVF